MPPILLATDDRLWILPSDPSSSSGHNSLYSSPDGKQWILVNPNISVPVRKNGGSLSDAANKKIWIMGGIGTGNSAFNDVWSSPDGTTWTEVTDGAQWSARSDFGCAYFQNKYWVMGGADGSNAPLNDVWSSADGKDWTQGAAADWPPRSAFGLTVFDNQLWVVGGQGADGPRNDVWSSPDGQNWTPQSTFGHQTTPPARARYHLFTNSSDLYAFAGAADTAGTSPPVFYLMNANGQWTMSTPPPGLKTAMYFGATEYNGGFWLAGGGGDNAYGSGVWVYAS
jgi:hypothetical protein